jgi:hypothetical protein
VYGGLTTRCCITCAKVHDAPWHAAYVAATRCDMCTKAQRSMAVYGGLATRCCITCAKAHDAPWYAAYVASTRCDVCAKAQRSAMVHSGLTTRCCITCAKTHDAPWYAAYVAATRCNVCAKAQRSLAAYGGLATRCCVACAKAHDAPWHAAYVAATRCRAHEETGCSTTRNPAYDGLCARCFAFKHPEDKRARFHRSKELAVGRFVREAFPSVPWTFDRPIEGGCSKRRPDIFVHLGSHALTIEVDEGRHLGYDCSCENRKLMEQFRDAGSVPHAVVRFNPDGYEDADGTVVPSCWGRTPKTGEPRVLPKHRAQWEARLDKLRQVVAHFLEHLPEKEIEMCELFY